MKDIKFHTIHFQKPISQKEPASENTNKNDTAATQHPIFIFPGISGNKIETLKLGENLCELNEGKRLINIYLGYSSLSLIEEAKLIADKLSEAPSKRFHFLLVGYSYGCIMTVLVAQYLHAAGHIPHLVLIDSPAPQVMKNYFTSASDAQAVTEDLISVMQYVAKLSLLEDVKFEKTTIEKIASEDFIKRVDTISKFILDHQSKRNGKNAATFKQYQESIKKRLQNILNLGPENQTRLEKINLLMTDKTAKKYHTVNGGWQHYAEEVHLIPTDKEDLVKEHTQLLADEKTCAAIAKLIHEIFIEDVLLKEMNIFLTDYSASHKDTNIDYARILNKLKKQLSEMGQLISLREEMNIEELNNTNDVSQKTLDGLNTASIKERSMGSKNFGLFCNNLESMQIEKPNDHIHTNGDTALPSNNNELTLQNNNKELKGNKN